MSIAASARDVPEAIAGSIAVAVAFLTPPATEVLGVGYAPTRAVLGAVAFGVAYLAASVAVRGQSP